MGYFTICGIVLIRSSSERPSSHKEISIMVGYSWTDDKGKEEKKGCGLGALLMMVVPMAAAEEVIEAMNQSRG